MPVVLSLLLSLYMAVVTAPVESAKRFLISKILEQASTDKVTLSPVERKMLEFDEAAGHVEGSDEFDREYDSNDYEAKVAELLRGAYAHDKRSGDVAKWDESLAALRDQDCYLLVMVDQAGIHRPGQSVAPLRAFALRDLLSAESVFTFGSTTIVLGAAIVLLFTPYGARFIHTDAARWAVYLTCIGLFLVIGVAWRRYFG